MKKRLTFVLAAMLFLSSFAAAYSIVDVDEPLSHDALSNRTETKQIVRLKDSQNPVDAEELASTNLDFNFVYNKTSYSASDTNTTGDMVPLADGYYYADFKPNFTSGMIMYELEGTSPEVNATEHVNVTNNTVDLKTDFSTRYKAGKEIEVEVSVMNEWEDINEDEATVYVYFTNGSWTGNMVQLGYNTNKELYTNNVELPWKANTSYVMHVNATTPGAAYSNAEGTQSVLLETYPSVEGELQELNASEGCNNQSFFSACERDAPVDTMLEITASEAEQVELDLLAVNRSNSAWVELESMQLTQDGSNWSTSFEIPDIDTSKYKKKVIARYNATNGARQFTLTRNISYRSYTIDDKSRPTTFKGSDYDIELLFAKYFTLEPLNSTRFKNASVTVKDPDGNELTSFQMSGMSYDKSEGLFRKSIDIPLDAIAGTYETIITAYNIYGEKKSLSSGFTVEDIDATFSTSGDMSIDISKTGNHSENVTLTNKLGTENVVEAEVKGGIASFTTVNGGDDITLSGSESSNVSVEFDIDYVDDYSGEIEFSDPDSGYNQTVDVSIEAPSCDQRTGILCLDGLSGKWINVTRGERGTTSRDVELTYFGNWNESTTVSAVVTGNVSDFLTVEPASIAGFNDTQQVTFNYSADAPGLFIGNVSLSASNDDTVNVLTKFDSNVESTETGISTASELDLGYFPSGNTVTKEIEVTNTGKVDITGLEVNSSTYSVQAESVSIPAGESRTVELTFESVSSDSGTVEISATTSFGSPTAMVSVTANPVPDYSSKADSLQSRITSLSSRAKKEVIQTRLQSLETEISAIKSAYQQGNYQEAAQKYRSVSSQLDSIATQISQQSGGTGQPGGDTGGGFPVLLVVMVLFVLLVIGFVAYTSIIPEEGDPLYNVMG
ncbi:MAG: hypothetical protein ABEJ91_02225 [Candidatus Nanohaloarchaea archaeon]